MNVLYVVRHGKSSWDDPSLSDHDRPLAPRGRRAATLLAAHIRRRRIHPDLVLCSSARRACETLEGILNALEASHVVVDRELYGASADQLLVRLRRLRHDIRSVMVVGHNPGLQDLVASLTGDGDDDAVLSVRQKFPTGALATLSFPTVEWGSLAPGTGHLETIVIPRRLE